MKIILVTYFLGLAILNLTGVFIVPTGFIRTLNAISVIMSSFAAGVVFAREE
jgi:hypothetical protein